MDSIASLPRGQAALVHALRRTLAHHAHRVANPDVDRPLRHLRAWQAARLHDTYADFNAQPRYAGAVRFFEDDLYGSADFSRRDADLLRVVPALARLAPAGVLECIARAVELNALTQDLDVAMVGALRPGTALDVASYCRAYRAIGHDDGRRHQIALIGEVGGALDRYVQSTVVRTSLAMMRGPAKVAGLGALQEFLERGFAAFRRMRGAREFLATVHARETALHEAIVSGRDDPFAEPVVARN